MIRFAERRDIGALLHLLDQVNRVHHEGRPDLFRRATKYGAAELEAILEKTDSPVFVFEDENGEILGHAFCLIRQVQSRNRRAKRASEPRCINLSKRTQKSSAATI